LGLGLLATAALPGRVGASARPLLEDWLAVRAVAPGRRLLHKGNPELNFGNARREPRCTDVMQAGQCPLD
jgi:hypothetical protein